MYNVQRLLLLFLFVQSPLTAQVSLEAVARNVKQDRKVRVHSPAGHTEGRYSGYTNNPLMVRLRVGDNIVPVGMIDSLWVHRSNVKKGAIIGALVAAVGSAAALVYICQADDDGCDRNMVVGLAAGPVVVGALIGGLLGAAGSGWNLRYSQAATSLMTTPLPQHRIGVGVSIPLSFGRLIPRR